MASSGFPHLTSPGRIGAMETRNRFAVTAMGAGLGDPDGTWGERIRAYHEEQARGGVGLIISGVAGVAWPVGSPHRDQVALSEDRFIPGLAAVVRAVHAQGARFAVQLHHGGPSGHMDLVAGRPLWVPSPPEAWTGRATDLLLPDEMATSPMAQIQRVDFRVMTTEDIALVVGQFAAAARRAVEAGVDGLEIHAAHGYILSSFLSPRSNRREDAYGGSLENRARFLLETIAAIRAEVGAAVPLWCKLDWREVGAKVGIKPEDSVRNAQLAEAAGVDAITVTANAGPDDPRAMRINHTPQIPGVNLPGAAAIKAAVKVPVISSGRVELAAAEAAIAAGQLDFLSMGRKMLADPFLPRKATEGRAAEIRPCIYCYTCISNIVLGRPVHCAVNPRTGRETEPEPAFASRRRVVVVGGGPAGMEAARRLGAAGQEVILLERDERLGGTLRFAALAYEDNEPLLTWLRAELDRSGVDVRRGVEATPELVASMRPDAVLVASGARRGRPPIPGADLPHVFSGDDLRALLLGHGSEALNAKTGWATRLAAKVGAATGMTANSGFLRQASRTWMPLGQRMVIIGGDLVGMELAEFLADRGRKVTLVHDAPKFGAGLPFLRRGQLLLDLIDHGVDLAPGASDIRIEAGAVTFGDAEGQARRAEADHVILATGATADLTLADALRAAGLTVHPLGDCTGVGYIEGAMRGAAEAVKALAASWSRQADSTPNEGRATPAPGPRT